MAEEKKFQYTSQEMPASSNVFAIVLSGDDCSQVSLFNKNDFESFVSNATVPSASHEDCLSKVPLLKKGWDLGKLCRFDVPANGQKGLRVAAYYFLGKREDTQSALPTVDPATSGGGNQGALGGEPSTEKKSGRKGA